MLKTPVALMSLMLVASSMFYSCSSSGTEESRAAPPSEHLGFITISNFTDLQKLNLTADAHGWLELSKQVGYVGLPEKELASTGNNEVTQPSIAYNSDGKGLVCWQQSVSSYSIIYAIAIDIDGKAAGNPISVSSNRSDQLNPSMAVGPNGSFVITWQAWSSNGWDIFAKKYDSSGNQLGNELWICASALHQIEPSIAIDHAGNFIICWQEYVRLSDRYYYIHAQRFNASAVREGCEINVSCKSSQPRSPLVATGPNNEFIIGYEAQGTASPADDIWAWRFSSNGTPLGSEIQVTSADNTQGLEAIACDSFGNSYFTWKDYRSGSEPDVYAARLNFSGVKIGGDIPICALQYDQSESSVAVDSKDNIIITWHDHRSRTDSAVYYQRYDRSWGALGLEGKASNGNFSGGPAVAFDKNDNITFAWLYYQNQFYLTFKKYYHPHYSDGRLATDSIPAPANFYAWYNITVKTSYMSASENKVYIDCSADNGASWQTLSTSGSLSAAGQAKNLKIRARLATTNPRTTPTLHGINIAYVSNNRPTVAPPANCSTWRNAPVDIVCNATDADGDSLTYEWTQTGGPEVFVSTYTTPNLEFTPNMSGLYSFKVLVNDSYTSSLPASITIKVENRLPEITAIPEIFCMKGDRVEIEAIATDPDGDELSVTWTQVEGSPSYIGLEEGLGISFKASGAGRFRFQVVANDGEAENLPVFVNLTVYGRPPVAGLLVNNSEVYAGDDVGFNASQCYDPDGTVSKYYFTFGDGSNSGWIDRPDVGHVYSAPGKYIANVTIKDDDGNQTNSDPVTIDVLPKPVVRIKVLGPTDEAVFWVRDLNVSFAVENLMIGPGLGYVIIRVDGNPEVKWSQYGPCPIVNLAEGRHLIQISLADGAQNRFQNPEAWSSIHITINLPKPSNMPDIIVTAADIVMNPEQPVDGDQVVFSVKISNIGLVDAGEFKIKLLIDNITLEERNIRGLNGSQSTLMELSWKADIGMHRFSIFTDIDNSIREYNETNNNVMKDIKVLPPRTNGNPPIDMKLILGIIGTVILVCIILIIVTKRQMQKHKR